MLDQKIALQKIPPFLTRKVLDTNQRWITAQAACAKKITSVTEVSYHNDTQKWKNYGKKSASSPISPQSSSKIAVVFTGLYSYFSYFPITSNCDRNISSLFISHDIFPFCIVADICVFTISWFLFYTFSSTNFSKSVLSKIGKLTANKSVNFEKDHSCSDTCNFPLLQCLNRLFHSSILVSHCVWQCIILIMKFM